MKKLIYILALISAPTVFAKPLKCHFTEPFVTMVFDSETSAIHYRLIGEEVVSINDVKLIPVNETTTEFYDGENLILTIVEDGKGNDGMSDEIMPYSAVTNVPKKIYGGCK